MPRGIGNLSPYPDMSTSMNKTHREFKVVAALAAVFLLVCSHGNAQVQTPEPTYDGSIVNGTKGISKTTEDEPNGYVERTWWEDGRGRKELIEIRHYNKGKPPRCIDHWITYDGPKGEKIIDDYQWSKVQGQSGKREVTDSLGTTTYE